MIYTYTQLNLYYKINIKIIIQVDRYKNLKLF